MKRILATAAAVLAAAPAFGQMMGGSISTASHFPLVDGARYEYVHEGGPWASSTVVVRAGQSWAGAQGLYAMHTTYTCAAGVACAPDATDFYGMGPGGVHWYGGTGADAAGARFSMMSLTHPEWVLANPAYPGTRAPGSHGGYANPGSWTTSVAGSGNAIGGFGHMSRYSALALETVTVPAGTFANALRVREERGNGVTRDVWYAPGVGRVMMAEGAQVARLAGYTMPGPLAQPGGGAAPLPFTPFTGLWWNPAEPGTGYNLQSQRGVMVATMFSYAAEGSPVWYHAAGPLARQGDTVVFTGTLDRYRGGQCVTCAWRAPAAAGDDGAFTITFTSASAAEVRLPGGRTTRIVPQGW